MAKKSKKKESKKKESKTKPQPPELTGGSGFTFEDAVAAYYLAALLAETYAPGIPDHTVVRVAVQQRHFKQQLDDVIVDFRNASGGMARLSLQVKRALTISAAKSNTDFRDIVRDSRTTYRDPAFRPGIDRYGAAVGDIAKTKVRDLAFAVIHHLVNDGLLQHVKKGIGVRFSHDIFFAFMPGIGKSIGHDHRHSRWS